MASEANYPSATSAAFDKSEGAKSTASGGRKMTTPVTCPGAPRSPTRQARGAYCPFATVPDRYGSLRRCPSLGQGVCQVRPHRAAYGAEVRSTLPHERQTRQERRRRRGRHAVVAVAAKNARMCWAMLQRGDAFKLPV